MKKITFPLLVLAFFVWLIPCVSAQSQNNNSVTLVNSQETLTPVPTESKAAATDKYDLYIYALAAPFETISDNVSFTDLNEFWKNADTSFSTKKIAVSADSMTELQSIFGGEAGKGIEVINGTDWAEQALSEGDWAILPFETIDPRWKIVMIDNDSPIHKDFKPETWPLSAKQFSENASKKILNRDPEKLTTMVLTGVTAMVRGTASYMDIDPLYPASKIREPLIQADILHVNNEVPFAKSCQESGEQVETLHFCSKTAYMKLLKDIGVDVVELDGDHFQDFGTEPVYYTLQLYKDNQMKYYGGGENKAEAQKPLLITDHGNRFAFIGCNGKEIGYAPASDTVPGAVHCDMDLITKQIKELKSEGIIPIMTFQHVEVYKVLPVDAMKADFEKAADAGAVIVSGSQSHIPMSFDLTKEHFIHFGLGNLFFDQAFFLPETSEAFIDRHVFYDGKYISTELLTIKFTNMALSRFMTEDERTALLSRIFKVSSVN